MPEALPAGAVAPRLDPPAAPHPPRRDIQGLRALAVTLVVLSHAGVRHVRGGYVGVDVFFVISGFLITSLLVRELSTTGTVSLRSFYARRALRLLPAATVVVLATLAGSWLFLSKVRFVEYTTDAISSAFYAVNFRLAVNGTDYLAQNSPPSPFQHFWSLAVEEQFYLLWPLLLLVSWKLLKRRRLWAMPLIVLCSVSLALSVLTTPASPSWAYFGSHTRVWELGVGALLALFAGRLAGLPARLSAPLGWIGLAAIVGSALGFDDGTSFPGYHALLPVLGAALVLGGGCSAPAYGAGRLLGIRPAVWLGGLSYGLYLWHWPLIVIGPPAVGRPSSAPLALAFSGLALLLAWATLRLVENPVRFSPAFRGRPHRAWSLGLGLSTGAAAAALVLSAFPPPIDSSGTAPALHSALKTIADPQVRLTGLLDNAAADMTLPANLTPGLDKVKGIQSAIYRDGCHVGYESTALPTCVYGDTSSDRVVVLFGDSHAAQWFPALDRIARTNGWRLVSMTKASCKVAAVTIRREGHPYTSCDVWRTKALARIAGLRPALVITSSSDVGGPVKPMADPLRGWSEGFTRTYRTLTSTGARVAAILDTPRPQGDGVDCAAANSMDLRRCVSPVPQTQDGRIQRAAIRAAAKPLGVAVIDPDPWLCTSTGVCPVVVGNTSVYRDASHMADTYAEDIAPVLGDRLIRLFGPDLTRQVGR